MNTAWKEDGKRKTTLDRRKEHCNQCNGKGWYVNANGPTNVPWEKKPKSPCKCSSPDYEPVRPARRGGVRMVHEEEPYEGKYPRRIPIRWGGLIPRPRGRNFTGAVRSSSMRTEKMLRSAGRKK